MADKLKELLEGSQAIDLAGAFLSVDTHEDSYTRTYGGKHGFEVVKTGDEYEVFEVLDGVRQDMPIILTDGDNVFYTAQTKINPYVFAYPEAISVSDEADKERAVLKAFMAFAYGEYQFGPSAPFHVFLIKDTEEVDGATFPEEP